MQEGRGPVAMRVPSWHPWWRYGPGSVKDLEAKDKIVMRRIAFAVCLADRPLAADAR